MKLPIYGVIAAAMCLFISCSSQSSSKKLIEGITSSDVTLAAPAEEKSLSRMTADTTTTAADTTNNPVLQSGSPVTTDWDKKIVKTANLSLEVKDYAAFNTGMHNGVKRFGAYTASEQQNSSDARIENSLTIKVPVDQFDNLINSIGGDGITVLSKEISTDDVTGEVIDTKARMQAKMQLRDKYEELLKGAKTMKDILEVQGEINGIQEELEAAAGRVAYLTHSAAYSTVTIRYFQYLNGNTADNTQPSFFTHVKEAFADGGGVFVNIFLFLVSIWPLLLAGGLSYVYVKRGRSKKVAA